MKDLYTRKQKVQFNNKKDFFNHHAKVFAIISIVLKNVVFEYQLKDLMLTTNYIRDDEEFIDFINDSINFKLLRKAEKKERIGDKTMYIVKDYAVKEVQRLYNLKQSQYKYSIIDAKTSYYKMYYILEVEKTRINYQHSLSLLCNILVNFTTFNIEKTRYLELYKKLDSKKILDVQGQLMLEDLKHYEAYKLLNFKKKDSNSRNIKALEKMLNDEIFMQKVTSTHEKVKNNKKFWDYNLGKISDNKSYFLFFNQQVKDGYKFQAPNTIDIIKFDVSGNFRNAELGEYIVKVLESAKMHIKEEYKNINIYIYLPDEDAKNKVFTNSINHKTARNGVQNLDSNLTARIKEIERKVYQCRYISFVDPKINYKNYSISYKVYYKPQNSAPDEYYTLTIYLKNANFENDVYSKEEQEQKEAEQERKRKQRQVEQIVNDTELLTLLAERLADMKS